MTFLVSDELKARIRQQQASRANARGQGNNTQATELKRSLEGPRVALGTKGRASGPGLVRYDAGVYLSYDLEHALARETVEQDVTVTTLTVPAGMAASTTFSFDEDHFLQGLHFATDSTDVSDTTLAIQPFGDPSWFLLAYWDSSFGTVSLGNQPSGLDVRPLRNFVTNVRLPLFIRKETDYRLASSDAGAGGLDVQVNIVRTSAPDGIRIPS